MLKTKKLLSIFFILFSLILKNELNAYVANVQTKMDSSGNALSVWQDDLNQGQFNIFASVLLAGQQWSLPLNISVNGGYNSNIPKIALNNHGNAFIVWTAYNVETGLTSLYAATLQGFENWSLVRQISDNNEQVNENFIVNLSENDDYLITWSGYSFQRSAAVIRSVSSQFGYWANPVTIAF